MVWIIRERRPPKAALQGSPCWRLSLDLAVRQCLPELLDALIRDRGSAHPQLLELVQPLEMFESGVRDVGAAEEQPFELGQSSEVFHSGIRDVGFVEDQRLELSHTLEVF